jgi:hypothetical protein
MAMFSMFKSIYKKIIIAFLILYNIKLFFIDFNYFIIYVLFIKVLTFFEKISFIILNDFTNKSLFHKNRSSSTCKSPALLSLYSQWKGLQCALKLQLILQAISDDWKCTSQIIYNTIEIRSLQTFYTVYFTHYIGLLTWYGSINFPGMFNINCKTIKLLLFINFYTMWCRPMT